jgi:hypothetical protein
MDYPEPGIATTSCITNMTLRCPRVQTLNQEEVAKVCESLEGLCSNKIDDVTSHICSMVSGLKKPTMVNSVIGNVNPDSMIL